jgi:UDP:flavonoid glycosyltransferase YjiC (YdhE family)
MVVVAIGADQPVDAQRAAELGIAIALHSDDMTAAQLRDAADTVLRDKRFRSTADAFRSECDAMDPIEKAIATLERIAATRGA